MDNATPRQPEGEGVRKRTATETRGSSSGEMQYNEGAQDRLDAVASVFAATADGMIICDRRGQIMRMNKAAKKMLEYAAVDVSGSMALSTVLFRILDRDGNPLRPEQAPHLRAQNGESVTGVVGILERRDGGRTWLLISSSPMYSADGAVSGTVTSLSDITDERRLSDEKEDLLRAVSHDLRNPLAAIRLHSHVMMEKLKGQQNSEELQEHASAILASSASIQAMIESLVAAAKLEGGMWKPQPETIELRPFVADLIARQETILPTQRVRLAGEDNVAVQADPHFVERILLNLLSNAFKYAEPDSQVAVTFKREHDNIVTSVSDHGPGIAPADMPHLFQRYYRGSTVREEGGLGLGLYIARMLASASGGRIWAASRPGQGSTFSFSLPAAS